MKKKIWNLKNLSLFLGLLVFITGCSNDSNVMSPTTASFKVGPVTQDSFSLSDDAIEYIPPYDVARFRPVLDASKLQAPTSSTACPQGEFDGFADWFFYLYVGNDTYMTFKMSGDSCRSELRQMEEWKTSTTSWRKMIGDVRVFYPTDDSLNQFTWMQIHDSSVEVNLPLIRLVWLRSRGDILDHLWAYVRKSVTEPIYDVVDLGPRPDGFFHAEVKVLNNKLRVLIDYVAKIENMDVSYWQDLNNYFKAGVYLQDDGTAKVQFKNLNYYNQILE